MNGVYLRELSPEEYADALIGYLREQGYDWDEERIRAAAPLVQEKIAKLGEFPEFAGFLFHDGRARPGPARPRRADGGRGGARRASSRSRRRGIEAALQAAGRELGLKPRQAFQPIRVAVTGSKISPGLFESLELLGRDESLARLRAGGGGSGLIGASGSSARWNVIHA